MALTHQSQIYTPLAPGETRLMRIGSSTGDLIECELGTFLIDRRPLYTALSYCWTKREASRQILLNGIPYMVRPNLYDYLKLRRKENEGGWIFVDALCINQDDVQERNHQVTLMRSIYADADEVEVWMGSRVGRILSKLGVTMDNRQFIFNAVHDICQHRRAMRSMFEEDTELKRLCKTILLEAFFNLEYWSRVWIIQEVVLARAVTLRSSIFRIEWDQFRLLAIYLLIGYLRRWQELPDTGGPLLIVEPVYQRSMDDDFKPTDDKWFVSSLLAIQGVKKARDALTDLERPRHLTLRDVMIQLTGTECSVEQDKVFGRLGLTDSILIPDYDMLEMELGLRVFAESLNDHAKRIDSYHKSQRRGDPIALDETECMVRLLLSLNMAIWDPVVSLTIGTILSEFRQHYPATSLSPYSIQRLYCHWYKVDARYVSCRTLLRRIWNSQSGSEWLLLAYVWPRLLVLSIHLQINQWTNRRFASLCCDLEDARTYGAWEAMATDIFRDVNHQLLQRRINLALKLHSLAAATQANAKTASMLGLYGTLCRPDLLQN